MAGAALEENDVVLDAGALAQPVAAPDRLAQPLLEHVDPALAHRDGGDHGHAELALQRLGIEDQAVALGHVDHVERDHHRQAQRGQLEREAQVIVEIGGIDHHDDRIGQLLACLLAEQHVARHRLIGRGGVEAVGARQIEQLDRAAIGQRQPAGMTLDGDARIIADLLPRAGQRVEQGALAGIGIADERNQRRRVHGRGLTCIAEAT